MFHKLFFKGLIKYFKGLGLKFVNISKGADIKSILYLYRYISWFFTCLFYLFTGPNVPLLKFGVIVTLLGAAKIATDIYIKFSKFFRTLEIAILIETLGITLLLIPTGGLNSPFIWYALNPVLVAASFLPLYFCWINLLFYLISASIISFVFFGDFLSIAQLIQNNAYFILVFILITFAAQLLSRLTRRLNQQAAALEEQGQELVSMNNVLQNSNRMYQESIEHIMSMYQIVETFRLEDDVGNLCGIFAHYASKLTKSPFAFVWSKDHEMGKGKIWVYRNAITHIEEDLVSYLSSQWNDIQNRDGLMELGLKDIKFWTMNIKSLSGKFGLIGVQGIAGKKSEGLCKKQLSFLSDLLGLVLEGRRIKELEDQLLIIGEQNRIANEIHDSVSQRIFSIVCGIAAISKRIDPDDQGLRKLFRLIRGSADSAMKELRMSIYGLSSRKKGEKPFARMIKEYLENLAQLHFISINVRVDGNEDLVSTPLKRAIYRIICEAAANAVHHGRCRRLELALNMGLPDLLLKIKDDGQGFNINEIKSGGGFGLGIQNMRNLVFTHRGNIDIKSQVNKNTEIIIRIPIYGDDFNVTKGSIV